MSHHHVQRGALALAITAVIGGVSCVADAPQPSAPRASDATEFVRGAEARLLELATRLSRADWVAENFITDDTETLSAQANEQYIAAVTEYAKAATKYDGVALPDDVKRKLLLLKLSLPMPAPSNPAELTELTRIATSLKGDYGKGKYCPPAKDCLPLQEIEQTLRDNRDPERLKEVWLGWRQVSVPMRDRYTRFVELSNKGAKELGFADVGAMWRSGYDMPPDAFAAEADRLWQQVRPLYASLHAYVRARMVAKYGAAAVRPDGLIPAHLLGNLWAQEWGNVYDVVAPPGEGRSLDLTAILRARKADWKDMVTYGEGFFTSLGFAPLPPTFWERSLFVKPRDRDVVCHASAWSIDYKDDIRLKMCIEPTSEDFVTIHHELGHNFYQRAYNAQSFLFQNSANDGFHEAVGDAIALSVTPEYLKTVGLLDSVASRRRRHPAAPSAGARQGGVPAVRPARRSVAMEGLRRRDHPRELQRGLVAARREVPGRGVAGSAQRTGLRPGVEVPRGRQHALHAVLPRGTSFSSSSSAPCVARRACRARCTAARSTATPGPDRNSTPC